MNKSETELIKSLKNREQESFSVLFDLYSQKLYNLAYKMCRNEEDAQDIVQLTFVQALSSIESFKGNSKIYTWLYAIAKNHCLRLIEKRSRISSLDALVKSAAQPNSQPVCTAVEKQSYIDQVKEGCLLGLLNCLPFYQRISFILNVLLDVKANDVAQIIDKTETATRLLVFRARQNIKSFLCENCSLYNAHNPCRCENLIDFSLKKGWIERQPPGSFIRKNNITADDIEKEISEIKKITLLYGSVGERRLSEHTLRRINKEIEESGYNIFFSEKVK